jgi:tetratricopeptide (TPR) repeat protein
MPDQLPVDELSVPDLAPMALSPEEIDIEGFVEPPPEGFELDEESNIPLPDFLKNESPAQSASQIDTDSLADMAIEPGELPELDPFADSSSLLDEFASELPEELGGNQAATRTPVDISENFDEIPQPEMPKPVKPSEPAENSLAQLSKARELSGRQKWKEVIELLNPLYASERNQEIGLLLANALLETKEAIMAMEIVETLDIDPELMHEPIKDILYRTGLALEGTKKFDEALRMYDLICSADINYKDAFDRSDKIYNQKKS